jgi:uncharacterized protein YbjT (DUF2867 family)
VLGPDVDLAVGDFADCGSIAQALGGVDREFLGCGNVPGQVEFECAVIDEAVAAGCRPSVFAATSACSTGRTRKG